MKQNNCDLAIGGGINKARVLLIGTCLFALSAWLVHSLTAHFAVRAESLLSWALLVLYLIFVATVFYRSKSRAKTSPRLLDALQTASTTLCTIDAEGNVRFSLDNQPVAETLETCRLTIPNILLDVERARKKGAFMTFYNLDDSCFRVNFQRSVDHPGHVDIAFVDITRDQRQAQALDLADRIFNNTSDAIIVADARRYINRVNHPFTSVTGFTTHDIAGMRLAFPVKPENKFALYREVIRSLKQEGFWCGDVLSQRKNGEIFSGRLKVTLNRTLEGKIANFIAYFSDVTELKRSEEELRYLANHDTLTGLPNRRLFFDRIDQAIKRAKRSDGQFAVYFVDLDGFKAINDELGHPVGDELLKAVAGRLHTVVRATDTVARLAGDEFTIVAEQIDGPEEIKSIADKIVRCFDPAFMLGEHQVYASASVGVCVYPLHGEDIMELVKGADSAMYRAKHETGRGSYFLLNSAENEPCQVDGYFVEELRGALDRGQMRMLYQPQVLLESGEVIGCEALLRWQHQQLGQVPPSLFMPVAAQQGVLTAMELWGLTQVCEQMVAWLKQKLPVQFITLNLTGQQITSLSYVGKLREVLQCTGLSPDKLVVEISELSLIDNLQASVVFVGALKDLGVETVVDDFGTSQREFSYLKRLPVSGIKIDNRHLQNIKQGQQGDTLFRAMLGMGEMLGLKVIAEGVERGMQEYYLQDIGCVYGQGFLYGKPMMPESFQELFNAAPSTPGRYNA